MKIKINRNVGLLLMILGLAAVLGSCNWYDTSSNSDLANRVKSFANELNSSSRTVVYLQFSPNIADYREIKDPFFWDLKLTPVNSYEIIDIEDNETLKIAQATLNIRSINRILLQSSDVAFTFERVGGSMLISKFVCDDYDINVK